MKNPFRTASLLGAVLILSTACQELDVENLNAPDRRRALAQPQDLQQLLQGSWEIWFNTQNAFSGVHQIINVMGAEMTAVESAATEVTEEPRRAFRTDDAPGGPAQHMANVWRGLNQMSSNVHDYLSTVEDLGLTFREGNVDVTQRNRAFAKFIQGFAWGYQSLVFDQGVFVPETVPYISDTSTQGRSFIKPWEEGLALALASLDEAILIANQNTFTFPVGTAAGQWFGTPTAMNNQHFARMANTTAARLLVESARTPQQRAAVAWPRVLAYTANGLNTQDFEMRLAAGIRSSAYLSRIQNNVAGCTSADCQRLRYELLGPADISGAYQAWRNTDIAQRDRFDIVTPDRRITGDTPQSPGAYVRWHADNNGFASALGHYRRSAYQWARHLHGGFAPNTGNWKQATVDENNLLRAEALIHLNRLDEAVPLINISRTRQVRLPNGQMRAGLPAVTAAGVPQSADCVPRTEQGACGDLLVALRYEKMVELVGMGVVRGWADARGYGLIPEGTAIQYPVTSTELQAMGLPEYTFGGIGTPFGAQFRPVTLANFRQ